MQEFILYILIEFCKKYAKGDLNRGLECSDYVFNCAIKPKMDENIAKQCIDDFKSGKRRGEDGEYIDLNEAIKNAPDKSIISK